MKRQEIERKKFLNGRCWTAEKAIELSHRLSKNIEKTVLDFFER